MQNSIQDSGSTLAFWRRVFPFALLILVLVLTASTSIYLLSAVRAIVAGESFWSKAQKDAIYYLTRYADEGHRDNLLKYQSAMRVPRGDAEGRDGLDENPPNIELARQGFLQGGNHPDDINSLIWLLRSFRHLALVKDPIHYWKQGDDYLAQLQKLAEEIEDSYKIEVPAKEAIETWKREIDLINSGATPAAKAFTDSLGRSSRIIVYFLLIINSALAIVMVAVWSLNTQRALRQKKQSQSVLDAEKERAQITLAALGDTVITTDSKGLVNYINPVGMGLLGAGRQTLIGRPLKHVLQFYSFDANYSSETLLEQLMSSEVTCRDDQTHWLRRANQSTLPVKIMGSSISHYNEKTGAVIVLRDVSREQQFMDQISWNSRHDTLTGLENRGEFERRLQHLLNQARHQIKPCALIYIDLDQFKLINETSSHRAGDEVLCEISRMLQNSLRESDCLARMGGDEFGILLENCPPQAALAIAEKLRLSAEVLQVQWGENTLRTGFSLGLVHIPGEASNAADLLRLADMACYQAKEKGRNKVFVYTHDDGSYRRYVSEMEWVMRLRSALDSNRFCLYAQSIAPLQNATEHGMHFEVLLRLKDEQGQIINPGTFIPAAERYGMMPMLDRWVISHTLQSLAQRPSGSRPIQTCAINLSGPSLDDDNLLSYVKEQMALHGIPPHLLCFEITETSAIANLSNATRLIQALRALGCRFALDDFGVGMSSLTYLKQLPVDYVKIDGGFVRDMLQEPSNHAMVEMINRIVHILGKKTVAEFVESREIAQALQAMGVDYAQGYVIARPTPLLPEYFMANADNELPVWCSAMTTH